MFGRPKNVKVVKLKPGQVLVVVCRKDHEKKKKHR